MSNKNFMYTDSLLNLSQLHAAYLVYIHLVHLLSSPSQFPPYLQNLLTTFHLVPFRFVPFRFSKIWFRFFLFHSIPFRSVPFHSELKQSDFDSFRFIPFRSVPICFVPNSSTFGYDSFRFVSFLSLPLLSVPFHFNSISIRSVSFRSSCVPFQISFCTSEVILEV